MLVTIQEGIWVANNVFGEHLKFLLSICFGENIVSECCFKGIRCTCFRFYFHATKSNMLQLLSLAVQEQV